MECVLSLFLIGLVGFVLARRGWISQETKIFIPRFVTQITLPPFLFVNIMTTFSQDQLAHMVYGSLVPLISVIIVFLLALGLAKLMRVSRGRFGVFCVGITASNTIFIGVPVNVALFGREALPYVLLYFFANTMFFWTVGNYFLSRDGNQTPEKILSLGTLKKIFSPPLLGFLLGVAMVLLNLKLPHFFMDAATYIGSLTTPLAIIFIGLTLASVNFKDLKPDRDVTALLIGRAALSPVVIYGLMRIFPLPEFMAKVFIIQASLPIVTSAALLAGYYGADARYASISVSLSTLLMLLTVPIYMVLLSVLPL